MSAVLRPVVTSDADAGWGVATLARRLAASTEIPTRFFAAEHERLAQLCLELARRFRAGGRLLAVGDGAQASDAQHVAVEFVHPVLVGKRALPSLALPAADAARWLEAHGRASDILLCLSAAPELATASLEAALRVASQRGLLTVALQGPGTALPAEWRFVVDADAFTVQEVHETAYHVLWELVHVFFEHGVV